MKRATTKLASLFILLGLVVSTTSRTLPIQGSNSGRSDGVSPAAPPVAKRYPAQDPSKKPEDLVHIQTNLKGTFPAKFTVLADNTPVSETDRLFYVQQIPSLLNALNIPAGRTPNEVQSYNSWSWQEDRNDFVSFAFRMQWAEVATEQISAATLGHAEGLRELSPASPYERNTVEQTIRWAINGGRRQGVLVVYRYTTGQTYLLTWGIGTLPDESVVANNEEDPDYIAFLQELEAERIAGAAGPSGGAGTSNDNNNPGGSGNGGGGAGGEAQAPPPSPVANDPNVRTIEDAPHTPPPPVPDLGDPTTLCQRLKCVVLHNLYVG